MLNPSTIKINGRTVVGRGEERRSRGRGFEFLLRVIKQITINMNNWFQQDA